MCGTKLTMKQISISVPTRGTITAYEISRAIENRCEHLENKAIEYPELEHESVPMKVDKVTAHSFFSKIIKEAKGILTP